MSGVNLSKIRGAFNRQALRGPYNPNPSTWIVAVLSRMPLFCLFRMIDFCHSVVYEAAKEKMPMASVDDPGEYFVPAGQEKQVKWLILLTAD